MASSRLRILREVLASKKTDLQRLYKFNFKSTKLLLFNADVYITSITHPQYNFGNTGNYRGYIDSVTKPNEVTITFLEDQQHTINYILDIWEGLKYNKFSGIHYPKAVYEDQALLIYEGEYPFPSFTDDMGQTTPLTVNSTPPIYAFTGFYPINRDPISLNFSSNEVQLISVSFNVDDIKLLTGLATLASNASNPIRSAKATLTPYGA